MSNQTVAPEEDEYGRTKSKTMVWVTGQQHQQLRELAALRGTSIASEVRIALSMYLDGIGTKEIITELEGRVKQLKASLKK